MHLEVKAEVRRATLLKARSPARGAAGWHAPELRESWPIRRQTANAGNDFPILSDRDTLQVHISSPLDCKPSKSGTEFAKRRPRSGLALTQQTSISRPSAKRGGGPGRRRGCRGGAGGALPPGRFLVAADKWKTSSPAIHSREASSFLRGGLQCGEEVGFWEAGPPGLSGRGSLQERRERGPNPKEIGRQGVGAKCSPGHRGKRNLKIREWGKVPLAA